MVEPEANRTAAAPAELLFGVAGWSYKDWGGIVYPAGADGATKMLAVAAACDVLEINTSFYATPAVGVTTAWARRLDRAGLPNRFVLKLNRVFSHEPQYSADDVRAVREAIRPLDDSAIVDRDGVEQPRLLGLLLQFPHYFRLTPENTQRIERLAEDFADHTRFIELRHASWVQPVVYDWLRKFDYALVNIDLPASPRASRRKLARPTPAEPADEADSPPGEHLFPTEPIATAPAAYLRLHGRNAQAWFDRKAPVDQKYNYLYTPAELSDLADRIRALAQRTRSVTVVGNNHYRGKALATVLNLAHLLTGRRVKLPAAMLAEYPQLVGFAEPIEPAQPLLDERSDAPPGPKAKPKSPRPRKRGGDDPQMTLFD